MSRLCHDPRERYISLAPLLLVALACLAAYRFIARGAGHQELMILSSSVVYVFFMVFRPFIFRGMMSRFRGLMLQSGPRLSTQL